MAHKASRRGAADLGVPLMILAFLVIGGFMWWLYGQAQAEEQARAILAEEAAAAQDTIDTSGATNVAATDIQMDATPYEGQRIRLAGNNVASVLGTQGFWLEMPNGNPFLVSMSDALMAQGPTLTMGQPVAVVGTVIAMTPEIAAGWVAAGTISEGDQLAAEFATHYLEAETVRGAGVDQGGGNDGGGAGSN